MHKVLQKYLILFFLQLFIISTAHADDILSITSGRGEPFVNKQQNGFYDLIIKEMFRRLNKQSRMITLPSERALINANAGIDDGNVARIKGIEKKYTNLIMVPESIIEFEFVAFTKKHKIQIHHWQDLKKYNVAYINGWKVFENRVTQYKSLIKTRDSTQLFELLKKNRVDVVLYDLWSGVWHIKQSENKIDFLRPPIATYSLYFYIHKKHKKLVPKLDLALKNMKNDGTYQKIYNKSLNSLLHK